MGNDIYNPNLVYDIGMHKGNDTAFYLKKGFKVVGIEANPVLVDMCRNKFKNEIEEGKLIIIDKAIHNQSGNIKFYIDQDKDDWGSTIKEWNTHHNKKVREIYVESITLEQIIKEHGIPYYMKIDIEGADINCLKSLIQMNSKPKYISLELLAPFNTACMDSLDILSALKVLGYDKFNIVDQKINFKTKCPFPSLEGNYYKCDFNEESSGLFGKELSGNWANFDYLIYNYLIYYHEYKNKKINFMIRLVNKYFKTEIKENPIFTKYHWYDVHATY